jgi:membrane protein DedA with SNARE-associated domain
MIWELIISHPYISVFIGLVVGGESVLLPTLYLATQNIFSIKYVWCIALLAVAISDSFWYYVGYRFSP